MVNLPVKATIKVAYKGNYLVYGPFEAISMAQDDSTQCEHLLSQEIRLGF